MKKEYTLEEIKQAFWDCFHESGEIYFKHHGTDAENEESTTEAWDDFKELLIGIDYEN
jgi:hypothetical protein